MKKLQANMDYIVNSDSCSEVSRKYDGWSDTYDQNLLELGAAGNQERFTKLIATNCFTDVTNCRVIDIGAGTGLSGEALIKAGFTNIDAIDGSAGMLQQAKAKNIYNELFEEIIGVDGVKSFPEATYDLAYAMAVVVPHHLEAAHLKSLVNVVKPNGVIAIGIRSSWLKGQFGDDLETELQRLQSTGQLQCIFKEHHTNSVSGNAFTFMAYRRLM